MSSDWPTPTVKGNYARADLSATAGDGLATAVREWPTPTASSYGSSNNGSPGDGRDEFATKGKPSLAVLVRDGEGGTLSPLWVETLQGLPSNWTSTSGPAGADPTGMRKSRLEP